MELGVDLIGFKTANTDLRIVFVNMPQQTVLM